MTGNVEQQIILERMRNQYFMDMLNVNANYVSQQIASQPACDTCGITQPRIFHDASTHTYDLLRSEDVEMKTIP